ncbi:MAG: DUF4160 domain-containing protein [Chloroflexota bacterium]|nr:DUF4160 domain-containing protein [Chloroflexota bacterium]
MPRIGQFFGIVIATYFNDHAPPHFHATDGECEAVLKAGRTSEGWLSEAAVALQLEGLRSRSLAAPAPPPSPRPVRCEFPTASHPASSRCRGPGPSAPTRSPC